MLNSHTQEKFAQAILFFAHNTQALGKIKLFKLMFLLDFEHFRQTGRSVTGQEYRAWRMGPVPAGLVQQWDQAEDGLRDVIRIFPEEVTTHWCGKVVPLQSFDATHFSKRELRLLESIAQQYRETLPGKMVDVTQAANGAWSKTWQYGSGEDKVIEYRLAVPNDAGNRDAVLESADLHAGIAAA